MCVRNNHNDNEPLIHHCCFQAVDAEDWSEVDVTSTQLTSGVWYGKAELDTLRPSTQYMVQVRGGDTHACRDISKYGLCAQVSSLNNEGYSKFSEVTFFTTSKEGNGNENVSYYTVQKIMFCHNIFSENYTKEAISTGSPASCNFMSGVLSLMTIIVLVIS